MKRKHKKTRPAAKTARPNRCYKDTVFRMPMQVKRKWWRRGNLPECLLLLEELGTVPEALQRHILAQCDPAVLQQWLKAAAGAESIASFTRQTGL